MGYQGKHCTECFSRGWCHSLRGWFPFPLFSWAPADGELYSGTSYNFLGSEPIISRNSSHSPLRTEYAIPWLNGKEEQCTVVGGACLLMSTHPLISPFAVSEPWGPPAYVSLCLWGTLPKLPRNGQSPRAPCLVFSLLTVLRQLTTNPPKMDLGDCHKSENLIVNGKLKLIRWGHGVISGVILKCGANTGVGPASRPSL